MFLPFCCLLHTILFIDKQSHKSAKATIDIQRAYALELSTADGPGLYYELKLIRSSHPAIIQVWTTLTSLPSATRMSVGFCYSVA